MLKALYSSSLWRGRKLLSLFMLLFGSRFCFAQKVLLHERGQPVEKIISEIETQTGYQVNYSPSVFTGVPSLDADLRDSLPVQDFFTHLLKGLDLIVQFGDKTVTIFRKNLDAPIFLNQCGKIWNAQHQPLPLATVSAVNGATVLSLNDGSFSLPVKGFTNRVTISYAGYERMELNLCNRDTPVIIMEPGKDLDQVQVEPYGTTTQRLSTSDLHTVSGDALNNQSVFSFPESLEGQVPGLDVRQQSGLPGGAFKLRLGGQHSMQAENEPLYIIDGIPISALSIIAVNGPGTAMGISGASIFNGIPPDAIASIVVMKGASATSIYGSRAANGAVFVTLKKGKAGPVRCTVDVYSGFTRALKTSPYLNTEQFLAFREEATLNAGLPVNSANVPELGWGKRYTNFQKEVLGNTGLNRNARIDLSGGNSRISFLLSGILHQQSTILPGYTMDWRPALLTHLQAKLARNRLQVGFTSLYSREHNALPIEDPSAYIATAPNVVPFTDSTGKSVWSSGGLNFVNIPALAKNTYRSAIDNLLIHLQANMHVSNHVSLEGSLGYYTIRADEKYNRTQDGQPPVPGGTVNVQSVRMANTIESTIAEGLARYTREIGQGVMEVIAGGSFQVQKRDSLRLTVNGSSGDLFLNVPAAAGGTTVQLEQGEIDYRHAALFGRGKYSFKDKYILSASLRRDGSDRFGPGKQFGTFWAIDGGWVFGEEPFSKNWKWLRFGKLWGGYGITGNDQIGDYQFMQLYAAPTGARGYQGQPVVSPSTLFNPDLRWELTENAELGLDLEFLNGRLGFSVLAYRSQSKDQLLVGSLPSQTGEPGVLGNQNVKVRNDGLEFIIRAPKLEIGHLGWASTINLTFPSNVLVSFPNLESSPYATMYVTGKSLSVSSGFHFLGVNPSNGLYMFQDINKDGKLDFHDFQPAPNLDPHYYGGWSNTFTYKGWQLDLFVLFYRQKAVNPMVQLDRLNPPGQQAPAQLSNVPVEYLDHWRKPGDLTNRQRISASPGPSEQAAFNEYLSSDAGVCDASFLRVKNVSLRYRFGKALLQRLSLQELQLYIHAQNLFTLTNYRVADPETKNTGGAPPVHSLTVGFTLSF